MERLHPAQSSFACSRSTVMSPVHDCDVEQARMRAVGLALRSARYVWRVNQSLFAEPEIMARPLDNPKQPRFELAPLAGHLVRRSCAPKCTT